MKYNVKVKTFKGELVAETRNPLTTDNELMQFIGWLSFDYFLAIECVDYKDAYRFKNDDHEEDALLWFTTTKQDPSEETTAHRHGMKRGCLAWGYLWTSEKRGVDLIVEQINE